MPRKYIGSGGIVPLILNISTRWEIDHTHAKGKNTQNGSK
jgi:hypothetical protein